MTNKYNSKGTTPYDTVGTLNNTLGAKTKIPAELTPEKRPSVDETVNYQTKIPKIDEQEELQPDKKNSNQFF